MFRDRSLIKHRKRTGNARVRKKSRNVCKKTKTNNRTVVTKAAALGYRCAHTHTHMDALTHSHPD